MKNLYRYAVTALVGLLWLGGCSTDESDGQQLDRIEIKQPQVMVRNLTTTGFVLRWEAVQGAKAYAYTFNSGTEEYTTECELRFENLTRQTEYVVAVKAVDRLEGHSAESPYTYIHVVTDHVEQLPLPRITLGSAYASCTIISWSDVPEAMAYEYTLHVKGVEEPYGGKSFTTTTRQITFADLGRNENYEFKVQALTSDGTRFNDSEEGFLEFSTSSDDVPPLFIAPTDVISDATTFDIYAVGNVTYFYDVVPATIFTKYTAEQIMASYRQYALDYAKKQGISIQLAMASLLKSGTNTMSITGLTPELSYVIMAFGMDLKGNITTGLSTAKIKTTADGYSAGPNYGGSESFRQSYFISNAYIATGYNWTNSVITFWSGQDIVEIRYRTLATQIFNKIFADPNDKQSIIAFLKDDDYGLKLSDAYLNEVNTKGATLITPASTGVSYTISAVARTASGEEVLCVNSTTTKTSSKAASWFLTNAFKNDTYGPGYNTVAGAMQGVSVASCRYLLLPSTALSGISTADYAALVEEHGVEVDVQYISHINDKGFAIIFGPESGTQASTAYTFIATAVNLVGDKLTKWSTVTTDAAPVSPVAPARTMQSSHTMKSLVGVVVPNLDKFIFPMESILLPEETKVTEDAWTIMHNMQILK